MESIAAGIVKPLSPATTFSRPYKLSQALLSSKIECRHEQLYIHQKCWTTNHPEAYRMRKPCTLLAPDSGVDLHQNHIHLSNLTPLCATTKGPRGFGKPPKKSKKEKKSTLETNNNDDNVNEDVEIEERGEDVIPEIVTNRMISRIGFSVGIPLFIGLLFFPLFYYLKVVLKIDVPSLVPVLVSFIFFGTALLGVSYGIVSSSWDPLREGSMLGWNEAQKNWPVFWQSLIGRTGRK